MSEKGCQDSIRNVGMGTIYLDTLGELHSKIGNNVLPNLLVFRQINYGITGMKIEDIIRRSAMQG